MPEEYTMTPFAFHRPASVASAVQCRPDMFAQQWHLQLQRALTGAGAH